MNLNKFLGNYHFKDGYLTNNGHDFVLFVAPSITGNPASPPYQLLFRQHDHPNHNKRLTGLFSVDGSGNKFRGDIYQQGKRETFYLLIDRTKYTIQHMYEYVNSLGACVDVIGTGVMRYQAP